jgi:hypothetical protein
LFWAASNLSAYFDSRISEKFCDIIVDHESDSEIIDFTPNQGGEPLTPKEKIDRWNRSIEDDGDPKNLEKEKNLLAEYPEVEQVPDFSAYKPFLIKTEAYKWLLSKIKTEFLLERPEPNIIGQVKQSIIHGLSASLPDRLNPRIRDASSLCQAEFVIDWSLMAFLADQGYTENPDKAIAHAIILVGTETKAQATTCIEYMRQTWPVIGENTLLALQNALIAGAKNGYTRK